MITIIIINIVLVVLSVLLLTGRGDKLIAGYNTLTPKEREGYHVKRLRLVLAVTLLLTTLLLDIPFLIGDEENVMAIMASVIYIFIVCFVAIFLANTWCRK